MKRFPAIALLVFTLLSVSNSYAFLGDLDGSGFVDGSDLIILSNAFGSDPASSIWDPRADVARSGIVDGLDLTALSSNFGYSPAPGSVAANIIWGSPSSGPSFKAGMGASSKPSMKVAAIDKVKIAISGTGMTNMSSLFDYNAHTGLVSNVTPGTGRLLVATGLDAGGIAIFHGSTTITVEAGKTTYVSLYATEVVLNTLHANKLAGGGFHSSVLKSDGTIWGWGRNAEGAIGDGSTALTITTPAKTSQYEGLIGAVALSAGDRHTMAIRHDGTVWTWGDNDYGQIGNGGVGDYDLTPASLASEPRPVQVFYNLSAFSNVTAVSAGGFHSVALQNGGTVWTWGYNNFGQLGHSLLDITHPVQLGGLLDIRAIAAGALHTVALKQTGEVWSWGYNKWGQLGDGSQNLVANATPRQVMGNLSGIVAISAGFGHSVALKNDGTVRVWGDNDFGQLGFLNISSLPALTPGVVKKVGDTDLTNIVAISAGDYHTLALDSSGSVWAWGRNDLGQLGNDTQTNSARAVQVKDNAGTGTLSNIVAISAGADHSMALDSNGNIWVWGDNDCGQVGNGLYGDCIVDNAPVPNGFVLTPFKITTITLP